MRADTGGYAMGAVILQVRVWGSGKTSDGIGEQLSVIWALKNFVATQKDAL